MTCRTARWYDPDPARPNPYLSDGALWLIDVIGCALATLVLEDVPGSRWEVYRVPKRYIDAMQNRTVLTGLPVGRPVNPSMMVYGAVIRSVIHGKPWEPGALRGLYDFVTTLTQYRKSSQRARAGLVSTYNREIHFIYA